MSPALATGGFAGVALVVVAFGAVCGLVGAIGLEVFGQYGADTFADPVEVFDAQVTTLLSLFVDRN